MRISGQSLLEGVLADWLEFRPEPDPRLPAFCLPPEDRAAQLAQLQRNRARDAAREAELILAFAADRPDSADPPPDQPGAKKTYWRSVAATGWPPWAATCPRRRPRRSTR